MNKKQKQELRQRQTARQLMGISQLTGYGVRTAEGELAFFLIKPDNLSVLSEEGVRGRVTALTHLLCAMPELRILALDSRESFQRNQEWYRQRLEQEGIRRDGNLDYTCGIFNDDWELAATGSCFGNTIRCLAVSGRHRGEGLLNQIVSHLVEVQLARGSACLLYTSPSPRD